MRTLILAATLLALCLLLVALSYAASARGLGVTVWKPVPSSEFVPLPTASGRSGVVRRPAGAGWLDGPISVPSSSTPPPSRPPRLYLPTHSITGVATWYSYIPGQAAAAKALRSFLGNDWRGTVVRVTGPNGSLDITLTDWESSLIPGRLIDLDSSDFRRLCGLLSRGVCDVKVSR